MFSLCMVSIQGLQKIKLFNRGGCVTLAAGTKLFALCIRYRSFVSRFSSGIGERGSQDDNPLSQKQLLQHGSEPLLLPVGLGEEAMGCRQQERRPVPGEWPMAGAVKYHNRLFVETEDFWYHGGFFRQIFAGDGHVLTGFAWKEEVSRPLRHFLKP